MFDVSPEELGLDRDDLPPRGASPRSPDRASGWLDEVIAGAAEDLGLASAEAAPPRAA